jgi:hypothetical protein
VSALWKRTVEGLLVAALAALFFQAVMFRQGTFVYLFHKASTGAWIDEGARVAAGEVPYRDFQDRVAPGILYLNAALLRAGGERLATFAWAGVAMGCLLTLALHALAGAIVRGPWRLAPPAVFAVLVYPRFDLGHPKWPALLLVLCAVGMVLHARGRPLWTAAAGAAAGLAMAFTPVFGLAALAGIALHLLREDAPRRSVVPALVAGALLAVAWPALALAARAGPTAVESWLGPVRSARPLVLMPWRWSAFNVAWLALVLAGLTATVWRMRATDRAGERLVARAGLVLFAAIAAGYVGPYGLAVHATLLTVLAAAAAEVLEGSPRWPGRWVAGMLAGGLATAAAAQIVWRQRVEPLVGVEFRAGRCWIGAPNLELPWIESRTRAGDRVFVFPVGGGSYFLTRTRNATTLPFAVEGQASLEDQRRALAEIEAARPAVGVWMGGQRVPPPAGGVPLDTLYDGILRSYRPERTLPDGTLLLLRRD